MRRVMRIISYLRPFFYFAHFQWIAICKIVREGRLILTVFHKVYFYVPLILHCYELNRAFMLYMLSVSYYCHFVCGQ